MYLPSSAIALFATLLLNSAVMANPLPFPETPAIASGPRCNKYEYQNIKAKPEKSKPKLISGSAIKGCGEGCGLSIEDSWTVGVEVSVGFSLGLEYAPAAAGISFGVAYSTTQGQAISKAIGCPAGAYCNIMATNHMVRVKGTRHTTGPSYVCRKYYNDYEILLPETIKTGDGVVSARVDYEPCFVERPKVPVEDFDYRDCPKA